MDRKLSLKLSALSFSTITSLTYENTARAKNANILGMNIDYDLYGKSVTFDRNSLFPIGF